MNVNYNCRNLKLKNLIGPSKSSAKRSGIDEKTVRKYRKPCCAGSRSIESRPVKKAHRAGWTRQYDPDQSQRLFRAQPADWRTY